MIVRYNMLGCTFLQTYHTLSKANCILLVVITDTSSGWLRQKMEIQRIYWIVKPWEVGNQGSFVMLKNMIWWISCLACFYSKHSAVKNLLFLYNRFPNSGRENLINSVESMQLHYNIGMWLLKVYTLFGREGAVSGKEMPWLPALAIYSIKT